MGKVIAVITTSLDGYVTGPDDGPGTGLGVGGERLHYWVMGGPWTYQDEDGHEPGNMSGEDKAFYDSLVSNAGAAIVGRAMYDAAEAWGGTNPFEVPLIVVTHRIEDQPDPAQGFHLVNGLDHGMACAREVAEGKDITIGGGADLIRQALADGYVDELAISTAPVVLGGGKRLFEGFTEDIDLEIRSVHQSPYATHVRYAVAR
jgi:dihydrofolate reductase